MAIFLKSCGLVLGLMVAGRGSAIATPNDLQSLDRGHRILIQRGLQLNALVFGFTTEGRENDPELWQNWAASNFTTLDIGFQALPPLNTVAGSQQWATWRGTPKNPAQSLPDRLFQSGQIKNLVSWQYKDEQDIGQESELQELETWIKHYRPLLPNTLLYTNQHGDERFGGYGSISDLNIQRYMRRIQPDLLMQDTYPYGIWNDLGNFGGRPAQLYYAMMRYRRFALAGNDGTGRQPIPYGLWTQTFKGTATGVGSWRRFPSESELRQQQFTALTLGFKLISAFTYNSFSDTGGQLDAPFFKQPFGKEPTPTFQQIAEINRQSLNLGSTLVRLLSTDVRIVPRPPALADLIAPDIPRWDTQADPYMTRLEAQNLGKLYRGRRGDVLVGYFKPLLESFDGPATNQHYFMLTNGLAGKRHSVAQTRQKLTVEFAFGESGITGLQRLNRLTGQVEAIQAGWTEEVAPGLVSKFEAVSDRTYRLTLILDGGTGDLFKFDTGAPFVGQLPQAQTDA
ncbi:hypothetical protein [Acaryochloris sp. IP29b_bin.137]|uniref:hypothetical protein n=1 Tax=Acaryochloris sp. IP29b_bin.137 TaxID=2969217 RepID=UPI0026061AB9|nr:hypothetical protein [Acaryochloris sp. IP29b_bin.137]